VHPNREDFKSKLSISFDEDVEFDPEKQSMNVNTSAFRNRVTKKFFLSFLLQLSTSIQDWVIVFNNIKIIEEVRRSSGSLKK